MKFTKEDIQEIEAHGLTKEQVQDQLHIFEHGVPNVKLIAAATVGDGIIKLDEDRELAYIECYEHRDRSKQLLKFTPASGAATRMFKAIYSFLDAYDPNEESIQKFIERTNNEELKGFFEGWKDFPFYERIVAMIKKKDGEAILEDQEKLKFLFLKTMMDEDGLNFGNRPKGLLPFHNYEAYLATAFEEHLFEAAAYAESQNRAELHFTVSPEHEKAFKNKFEDIHASVSGETDVNFKVNYSFQKPYTDTVAVNEDNTLYRKPDGKLLFRPGGHGALIENLNDVDADVVFIKNIDNVLTRDKIHLLERNKKILAGLLLELQEQVFHYAQGLEKDTLKDKEIKALEDFLQNDFSTRLGDSYDKLSLKERKKILLDILDRPLRVCGMVKNEGEPGGGPFWVEDKKGRVSLQIIESAQVDQKDGPQSQIFNDSTHFNPVDIVCGVRNYKGKKYDLLDYVDADLAFIASKTADGTKIKALELPGLWNGAMALWNTIFVEVPLETFNPVKTVNDLLKPSHQVSF